MSSYNSNYKGIIIQNDDPEQMGRVKVYVPQVNMTLYKKWQDDRETDKKFTNLGGNLDSSLSPELLDRLKKSLPWATIKQPIFGMGTGGVYHADKDFAEPTNDENASVQHKAVNQLPGSSSKEKNKPSSLSSQMAKAFPSKPEDSSSKKLNNYSNKSYSSAPSYIKNSQPTNNVLQNILGNTNSAVRTNVNTGNNDNISHVVINFTPNSRNSANLHRKFTSSASISDVRVVTGPTVTLRPIVGASIAPPSASSFAPVKVPTIIPAIVPYTPPIRYLPEFISPIRTSISGISSGGGADYINITFTPNSRNAANSHRTFTTSASVVVVGGSTISLNASAKGVVAPKDFSVHMNDITSIEVVYKTIGDGINLSSPRLGQLAKLFESYTNASAGLQKTPIAPPTVIMGTPSKTGGSPTPPYNRGGGGSELFELTSSDSLPLGCMTSSLIKGVNPCNKSGTNYGKKMPVIVDPNKTVGNNQQCPADALGPIRANSQNNKVKGMISIPAVGSHVSVYFDNGNPLYPIIDGVFYNQEDMQGVHDVDFNAKNSD